jgi:transposase InsO family protein
MYCYPLTIADQHTRYLLACQGLPSVKGVGVRPVFERLFREYGLPQAIRTDNGVPFATTGLHGLSQLNGWWRRLGIQHGGSSRPIPSGTGSTSGCTRPSRGGDPAPRANLGCQQRAFTAFRRLYNEKRPHAALGGRTPASRYCPSRRAYPRTLPPIEYPGHFLVKRVTTAGTIRFKKRLV